MEKEATRDSSFGTMAIILGILSIIFASILIIGSLAGVTAGILGIIFALKQKKIHANKFATWGLILSIIGLAINVIISVWIISTLIETIKQIQELEASGAFNQLANASYYAQ